MPRTLSDDSKMPFGKYKGRKMKTVPAKYLMYLIQQDWIEEWPRVQDYIRRNLKVIQQDLKDQESYKNLTRRRRRR